MECAECGYVLQEFDKTCRRCGRAADDRRPRDPDRIVGRLDFDAAAPGDRSNDRPVEVVVTPAGLFVLDATREGFATGGIGARSGACLAGCGAGLLTGLVGCATVAIVYRGMADLVGEKGPGAALATVWLVGLGGITPMAVGYSAYRLVGARARRRQRKAAPCPTADGLRAKVSVPGDPTFFIPMEHMLQEAYLEYNYLRLPKPWVVGQVCQFVVNGTQLQNLLRLAGGNPAFVFRGEPPG
jgi:hypothetical protein